MLDKPIPPRPRWIGVDRGATLALARYTMCRNADLPIGGAREGFFGLLESPQRQIHMQAQCQVSMWYTKKHCLDADFQCHGRIYTTPSWEGL